MTHQPALFTEPTPAGSGPVECLGLTFENDAARRAYFTEKLREKLQDPAFHQIEGFPLGSDEDILALSDPPYYTACPNPFLEDFVKHYGQPYDPANDTYHRQPFAVDVSEGKAEPIYAAHSYHTKVPYRAIVPAILYYTQPGDLVLDGFAGSGMAGVAVQMCSHPPADLKHQLELEWQAAHRPPPQWGSRRIILNDLAPAATFIAANYNLPFDVTAFEREARHLLSDLKKELGWMYETRHTDGQTIGQINYTVWSEVFACSNCGREIVFLDEAFDPQTKGVRDKFPCPNCGVELSKDNLQRLLESRIDPATGQPWQRIRLVPALINYSVGQTRYEKKPDELDLQSLERIETLPLPPTVPINSFPIEQMYHGSRLAPKGFTRIHHLYLPRSAQALGWLWGRATMVEDTRLRNMLLFFVEQAFWTMSLLNSYRPTGFSQVSQYMKGIYYVPSQHSEVSPWYVLQGKLNRLAKVFHTPYTQINCCVITTGTAFHLRLPNKSVDYIFTDPPFGENIYYADLNFLTESWYHVWTDTKSEAIVDQAKRKALPDYQRLMQQCFEEYYRVLKPGRWLTVVFHNSRNAVWTAIQEAMQTAGFIVADVRTQDKIQHSYRQVTSSNVVKQDLVISAYKPNGGLEDRFKLEAGTEAGAWDFVRTHLRHLPVFVETKDGRAELIAERMNYLLFDRMVAFHIQRGLTVPLSAAEFYAGLEQRFPKRDDMYFLPDQVAEYDQKRMQAAGIEQLQLFVSDEFSAIQWLRLLLTRQPQTFQEIHPHFMREIGGWQKHEKPLELSELLEQTFLRYDGGDRSHPNYGPGLDDPDWQAQLKGFTPDNPPVAVQREARHRWYVPDPNQAADLEKLREKALFKEFEEYRQSKQKKLKVFRLEAVRAGFKKAWQDQQYRTIIEVADKIPDNVLQEDSKLLMWYDQAVTRLEM
ncbi:MAG: DNA methylase [Anaerolineales bacterium]|nr:DNA methylase [Anaerolineales bacterium]